MILQFFLNVQRSYFSDWNKKETNPEERERKPEVVGHSAGT